MTVRFVRHLAGLLLVGAMTVCGSSAQGCDVPVFRYALEYWPAAPYEVTVLHHGALSAGEREALGLISSAPAPGVPRANAAVGIADLTDPSSAGPQRLWHDLGNPALPLLVLHGLHTGRPIWSGPLTASNVARLVGSPTRQEIARRLLEGHSAVWVLLQSGDPAKDAAARALLERTLRDLEQELKLPVGQGSAPLTKGDPAAPAPPPLQLRFSLVTVSRRDAAESVFVQLLLDSEEGLGRYSSEPMVFPIYGRGRALYALIGKGITRENLQEAGAFLVGSCSCEAKEQNPGTDLLIAADWERRLVGSAQQAAGPQPLAGLSTLSTAARAARAAAPARKTPAPAARQAGSRLAARATVPPPTSAPTAPPKTSAAAPPRPAPAHSAVSPPESSGGPLRNMLLTLGAIAAVAALLGVLAARRRPEERP